MVKQGRGDPGLAKEERVGTGDDSGVCKTQETQRRRSKLLRHRKESIGSGMHHAGGVKKSSVRKTASRIFMFHQ